MLRSFTLFSEDAVSQEVTGSERVNELVLLLIYIDHTIQN